MLPVTKRVQQAITDLKQGKMIIVIDDPTRENEGDLIMLSEHVTEQNMNFMIRHCSGIVCVTISQKTAERLHLQPMVMPHQNTSSRGTPFTVSVDAKDGITTGVSAADRTLTVNIMNNPNAKPTDLVQPGHLFPLIAQENGILSRQGHTEAAFDLAKIATDNRSEQAILCELMNEDGSMMRGDALKQFADKHQLTLISISELIQYRRLHENHIEEIAKTTLPLETYGIFDCRVFKEIDTGEEHLVLSHPTVNDHTPLVRIHSSCMTGDIFNSLRCDCHQQLHYSLLKISQEGGMIIYMSQEGRGIGLGNKIKAYMLQNEGKDTVEANLNLGLPADAREYHMAANILKHDGVTHIRLLTNNPAKVQGLLDYGIPQVKREAMPIFTTIHNQHYLETKRSRLNHHIDFNTKNN